VSRSQSPKNTDFISDLPAHWQADLQNAQYITDGPYVQDYVNTRNKFNKEFQTVFDQSKLNNGTIMEWECYGNNLTAHPKAGVFNSTNAETIVTLDNT
jgi:hypothetical protein